MKLEKLPQVLVNLGPKQKISIRNLVVTSSADAGLLRLLGRMRKSRRWILDIMYYQGERR